MKKDIAIVVLFGAVFLIVLGAGFFVRSNFKQPKPKYEMDTLEEVNRKFDAADRKATHY